MASTVTGLHAVAIDGRPVQSANGTGIGSYTSQLLRALARNAALDFHLLWMPGEPALFGLAEADYWSMGRDDLLEQEALPGWLEARQAQVYHLTQNGLGWPRRSRVPLVVTLHDVIPYLLPELVRPSYLVKFLAEVPGAVAAARRVITVSETARQDICRVLGAPPDKVVVIPSAPAASFHPRNREEARRLLARRYGLNFPFLLYVGGYNPRKNVAGLVWAYARIARFLPERHRLVLLGAPGPQMERLKRLAAALEIERELVCPGFIPRRHLPLFYAAADLFCYPSFYEGFGLPPLEAMACGTPVVASNAASMPEVLGDAAWLVSPADTEGLADALLKMLTAPDLAEIYRRRGFARVRLYRWDAIARRVLAVYEEAAEG